jgi:hypothetical protein
MRRKKKQRQGAVEASENTHPPLKHCSQQANTARVQHGDLPVLGTADEQRNAVVAQIVRRPPEYPLAPAHSHNDDAHR